MTDNDNTLIFEKTDNGILIIRLNRPHALNALNSETLLALSDVFSEADTDDEIGGIILTGKGKAFSAGADIEELSTADDVVSGSDFSELGQSVCRQLETLSKPSIAAVNGYAFGGGCELAMSTHIRMASKIAQFGQPEVKLGLLPGYGGTQRLSRLIGKGRAMDLCLTGRFIDAKTAYDWGLVTHVVSEEDLLSTAIETLSTILSMAPLAIQSVITAIDDGADMAFEPAVRLERAHFAKLCGTADKTEGVEAFLDKREANFTGE